MTIGIDASNIRRGGGVTHLLELLRNADPLAAGFHKVYVWSGSRTLSALADRPWLKKVYIPALDGNFLKRSHWQRTKLSNAVRHAHCDILFVPGGSYAGDFEPVVALSQNLLPFELLELLRFGFSAMTLKLLILRSVQTSTFRKARGLVFLTKYAKDTVLKVVGSTGGKQVIISHGIESRFTLRPRSQRKLACYSLVDPFRFIYVSILDVYKHQDKVARAIAILRSQGIPVAIDFVGPAYEPSRKKLLSLLFRLDPAGDYIRWTGPVPYQDLHSRYQAADACVFASSCENLPIILLEGMAAGLPVACSMRGPMPEVLGPYGFYFNPESVASIAGALSDLIADPVRRAVLAAGSYNASLGYSWQRSAREYFDFFAELCAAPKEVT